MNDLSVVAPGAQPPRPLLFEEFLVARGILARSAADRAKRLTEETGERLSSILVKLGIVSERELASALASYTGMELHSADEWPSEPILADRLSRKFLKEA